MNVMKLFEVVVIIALAATMVSPADAKRNRDDVFLERMMSGGPMLDPPELQRAIDKAASSPLGSAANPVRASRPEGQRAYLARLRCDDGRPPAFTRNGNVGPGVYMSFVDVYTVDCGSAAPGKVGIQMDMYFPDYVENKAVQGFTVAPD